MRMAVLPFSYVPALRLFVRKGRRGVQMHVQVGIGHGDAGLLKARPHIFHNAEVHVPVIGGRGPHPQYVFDGAVAIPVDGGEGGGVLVDCGRSAALSNAALTVSAASS